MKRALALLLVTVFALSLMMCGSVTLVSADDYVVSTQPAAEGDFPLFAVYEHAVLRGEEFVVPIHIKDNPGVVSLKLSLQYDDSVLELVEAVEQDFSGVSYGPAENNPFVINWFDTLSPNNTTSGVITNLTFRVKEGASVGSTLLKLSYAQEDVYNADWEDVAFSTQSAYVHVMDYRVGDVNSDKKINNRDLGLLLRYINGWPEEIHLGAADVTGDKNINNRDLGLLLQYINGWDVQLAQPLPSTPTPPVEPPVPPASDDLLSQVPKELKGTKINMQVWWTVGEIDNDKAEAFEQATGIQVAYKTATMDKYQTNLSATILAGNPPALAAIINEWYPVPITRGLMQPIKNTGWDYTDPIYATSLMDQFSYKGEHYGVALKSSAMNTFEVMFYNKDMLKANGVTQDPYELWKAGQWHWDTCLEIAQKCTNAKKNKYGLTLIYQNYWMLSAGQDFVLSDKNGLKNNTKNPQLLNAWYQAWDMIYTHKVIPTMFNRQQTLFYDGSVAMLGGGSYFMQCDPQFDYYVPQNCDFDWGVVPFPSPKGKAAVSACEGTVWGFPTKVKGNQLQAAMWYLRYYLDDFTYNRDIYPNEQCWEVVNWMWNQKIQSYNSVGVVTYGGKHSFASIQYSLVDESADKSQVSSNLESWYTEIQANIDAIQSELD